MAVESDRPKILFLCTGNSALSIFEYLTKKIGWIADPKAQGANLQAL
jgi:hypothetical protein